LHANFSHYGDLLKTVRQTRSVSDTFKVLFNKPGWQPDYLGGQLHPTEPSTDYQKYNPTVLPAQSWYVLAHFLLLLILVPIFFFIQKDLPLPMRIGYAVWVMMTTLTFGFVFEKTGWWLKVFEIVRLIAMVAGAYFVGSILGLNLGLVLGVFVSLAVVSGVVFLGKVSK